MSPVALDSVSQNGEVAAAADADNRGTEMSEEGRAHRAASQRHLPLSRLLLLGNHLARTLLP